MKERNMSKVMKLAAMKPFENEQDPFVRNYDGTLMNVSNAPIIRALSKGLGMIFEIVMPKDGNTGVRNSDGSWTGIIGMVERGEADLSISGITLTDERREAVNFSYPIHLTDVTFMTNKPEPQPKTTFSAFGSFSFEVWLALGVSSILVSLLLYVLMKGKKTYSTILLDVIGSLLEKSFAFQSKQRNTALLLFHWFLGTAVISSSFKAVILSVITFPRMIGIRDISDLSKAATVNSIKCMSYEGVFGVQWFESKDDKLRLIGECLNRNDDKSMHSHPGFLNYPFSKAFIADRIDLTKFSRDYFISDDSFSMSYIGMAYSRNFCCPKKLESVVHRIVAAHLYPKTLEDRDFMAQLRMAKLKRIKYDSNGVLSLTVTDLWGAFIILFTGDLLSFLLLIGEIISEKVHH